ncbi:hypothetical protein GCM10010121_001220 [Streptomyces brasiliensis]|uniref:Uncharacterized protein n=1 Tax=Streptomyces brasiliensis TaxID=1954 RepID=A0A917K260_9ACTN|nr:hypothetical protein GCM10010121_001220 [Streptomyces brasiliensis]
MVTHPAGPVRGEDLAAQAHVGARHGTDLACRLAQGGPAVEQRDERGRLPARPLTFLTAHLKAPLPEGRGSPPSRADVGIHGSGRHLSRRLRWSYALGTVRVPARTSITRAEFLSLGETAPHAVQA